MYLLLLLLINKIYLVSPIIFQKKKNIFSRIDAMTPSEILQKLGMNDFHGKHKWYIQPACAVTGEGVIDAMLEMANLVKQYRKENN